MTACRQTAFWYLQYIFVFAKSYSKENTSIFFIVTVIEWKLLSIQKFEIAAGCRVGF